LQNLPEVKGTLYIVATPIGNLEDITLRALRILKEADVIAAEDTRHTKKLLNFYNITKPLVSYWGPKEKTKAEDIIKLLSQGKTVALVTDAGTPGISDPGSEVVKKAAELGYVVVSIPGPSAFAAAISVSGFKGEFYLVGFLPSNTSHRKGKLEELKYIKSNLVVYESPHRLLQTLVDMIEILGNREAVLCHELTKFHESILRGRLKEIYNRVSGGSVQGEYVIIIKYEQPQEINVSELVKEVFSLMKQGMKRKEAVKRIASQYGISQRQLYEETLKEIAK